MESLVDPQGRPILLRDKPNFSAPGIFEGTVNFKLYVDAIEGQGTCVHCTGVVKQLVRLPKSDEIHPGDPDREDKIDNAKQALFAAMKGHHFCPILQADKRDADDWLKEFE